MYGYCLAMEQIILSLYGGDNVPHINTEKYAMRPSLVKHLEGLRGVPRFQSNAYPAGIFNDPVYDHVYRCLRWAERLRFYQLPFSSVLAMTILLHDLAEVEGGDFTIWDMHMDRSLASRKAEQEARFVKRHFDYWEKALMADYDRASAYSRGEIRPSQVEANPLSPAAVMAKVLDLLDGAIVFHRQMSRWHAGMIKDNPYDRTRLPDDNILIFGARQIAESYHRFALLGEVMPQSSRRHSVAVRGSIYRVASDLLADTLRMARWLWGAVEERHRPAIITQFFEQINVPAPKAPQLFRQ